MRHNGWCVTKTDSIINGWLPLIIFTSFYIYAGDPAKASGLPHSSQHDFPVPIPLPKLQPWALVDSHACTTGAQRTDPEKLTH